MCYDWQIFYFLLWFSVPFILTENFNDVCKLFQRRMTLIAWEYPNGSKLMIISCGEEYKLSNY